MFYSRKIILLINTNYHETLIWDALASTYNHLLSKHSLCNIGLFRLVTILQLNR